MKIVEQASDSNQLELDQSRVEEAVYGKHGPDQQRIAKVGLTWVATLLRKNSDYGSSVWQEPILAPDCSTDAAIRVRMSDKVSRIRSLLSKRAEVKEETIDDSIGDLGAYCLLLLASPKRGTHG